MEAHFVPEEELRRKKHTSHRCVPLCERQPVGMFAHGILYSRDNEHTVTIPNRVYESHKHCGKAQQPDTKDSVLCDSINVSFKNWQN